MDLNSEYFRNLLLELKKGNKQYLYPVIENTLVIVEEELKGYSFVTEKLINIGILACINAIRLYDFEKSASFESFVKQYVHLSLLAAIETKMFINELDFDLRVPAMDIIVTREKLQQYVIRIKKSWQEEDVPAHQMTKFTKKQ